MTWALLVSLLAKSSLVAGAGLVCARRLTRDPVERVKVYLAAAEAVVEAATRLLTMATAASIAGERVRSSIATLKLLIVEAAKQAAIAIVNAWGSSTRC